MCSKRDYSNNWKEVSCPSPSIPWTKLKKSLKNILNCCKLQIVFKNKTKLGNTLTSRVGLPMSPDSAMSPIMVNVWETRILELMNILVYHHQKTS